MIKKSDNELVALSLQQDHIAYAELVNRYKGALYRHIFAIVQDEDIAEDVAQETFVAAYYKLSSYDNTYRFATWLFKISTNKALNTLKRASKSIRVDDEFFDRQHSNLPSPEARAIQSELEQAIASLAPKYQIVIRLHYWQGMKYTDIAQVLSLSEGTVKSLLHRAKQQLRKELS